MIGGAVTAVGALGAGVGVAEGASDGEPAENEAMACGDGSCPQPPTTSMLTVATRQAPVVKVR